MRRQVLDVAYMGLLGAPVRVRIQTLIGFPVEGLWVFELPGGDLILIHPDGACLYPGLKAFETLGRVVGADTRRIAVVPSDLDTTRIAGELREDVSLISTSCCQVKSLPISTMAEPNPNDAEHPVP